MDWCQWIDSVESVAASLRAAYFHTYYLSSSRSSLSWWIYSVTYRCSTFLVSTSIHALLMSVHQFVKSVLLVFLSISISEILHGLPTRACRYNYNGFALMLPKHLFVVCYANCAICIHRLSSRRQYKQQIVMIDTIYILHTTMCSLFSDSVIKPSFDYDAKCNGVYSSCTGVKL